MRIEGTWLGRHWLWLYLPAGLAYLAVEFMFNAALLETVSGLEVDRGLLKRIELFGRTVSAAGCTLAVLNILVTQSFDVRSHSHLAAVIAFSISGVLAVALGGAPYWPYAALVAACAVVFVVASRATYPAGTSRTRMAYALAGIALIGTVGGTMFFGQKAVVERWVIEPTAWQERLYAQYMHLLKLGLARNIVRIEAAPFDPERMREPEERTFLALVGFLVVNSREFIELVEREQGRIVREVSLLARQDELPTRYRQYRAEGEAFQKHWRAYEAGSREYAAGIEQARRRAAAEYARLLNDARAGYQQYRKAVEAFRTTVRDRARAMSPKLAAYLKRREQCRREMSDRCVADLDRNYSDQIKRYIGAVIPRESWCQERLLTPGDAVVNTMGFIVLAPIHLIRMTQGREVTGMVPRYVCDASKTAVESRLLTLLEPDFTRKSGGYPSNLVEGGFYEHPLTAREVQERARKEGVVLPQGWRIGDADVYREAVFRRVKESKLDAGWRSQIERKVGGHVPPGLAYTVFVRHPVIQERIRETMGKDYVSGMHWEMSEREFHEKVLGPATEREINAYLRRLKEEAMLFENGASREPEGKEYVRAVAIPPISLFLSGFFAVFNLVMILKQTGEWGIGHMQRWRGREARTALMAGGIGTLSKRGRISMLIAVVGLTLILVVVPLAVPNKFTESRAFRYFSDEAIARHPVSTLMLNWVIRVQPVIYPIGAPLWQAAAGGKAMFFGGDWNGKRALIPWLRHQFHDRIEGGE